MSKMPARVQLSAANSGTVGTSAADMIGENQERRYLRVHNPAAAAASNIAFRPDDGTDPVINGAGTITLAPGETAEFSGQCVPNNAFRIIGDTAGSPYTVWEV